MNKGRPGLESRARVQAIVPVETDRRRNRVCAINFAGEISTLRTSATGPPLPSCAVHPSRQPLTCDRYSPDPTRIQLIGKVRIETRRPLAGSPDVLAWRRLRPAFPFPHSARGPHSNPPLSALITIRG